MLQKALSLVTKHRRLKRFISYPSLQDCSNLLTSLRIERYRVTSPIVASSASSQTINLNAVRSTLRVLLSEGKLLEILILDNELRKPIDGPLGSMFADLEVAAIVGIARAWASDSVLALVPQRNFFPITLSSTRRKEKETSKEIQDPLLANRLLLRGFVHRKRWRQAAEVAALMSEKEISEALSSSGVKSGGEIVEESGESVTVNGNGNFNLQLFTKGDEKGDLLRPCILALEDALGSKSSPAKFAHFFDHFLNSSISVSETDTDTSVGIIHQNDAQSGSKSEKTRSLLLYSLLQNVRAAEEELSLQMDVAAAMSQSPLTSSSSSSSNSSARQGGNILHLVSALPLSHEFCSKFSAACVDELFDDGAAWLLQRFDALTSFSYNCTENSLSSVSLPPQFLTLSMLRTDSSSSSSSVSIETLFVPLINSLGLLGLGNSNNHQITSTHGSTPLNSSAFSLPSLISSSVPLHTLIASIFVLVKCGRFKEALDGAKVAVRIQALQRVQSNTTSLILSSTLQKRGEFLFDLGHSTELVNKQDTTTTTTTIKTSSINDTAGKVLSKTPSSSQSMMISNIQVPAILSGILHRESPSILSSRTQVKNPKDTETTNSINHQQMSSQVFESSIINTKEDAIYWRSALTQNPELALLVLISLSKLKRHEELLVVWNFISDALSLPLSISSVPSQQDSSQDLSNIIENDPITSLSASSTTTSSLLEHTLFIEKGVEQPRMTVSSLELQPLTTALIMSKVLNSYNTLSVSSTALTSTLVHRCTPAFSTLVMQSCLALGKEEEAESELKRFATLMISTLRIGTPHKIPVSLISCSLSVIKARISSASISFPDVSRWLRFLSSSHSSTQHLPKSSSSFIDDEFYNIALLSFYTLSSPSISLSNETDPLETISHTHAALLAQQGSFINLIVDMRNSGIHLSPELGEQILVASLGVSSTNKDTRLEAVKLWASSMSLSTPLLVCRQILASSSILNLCSNDTRLFFTLLTLLTKAASSLADVLKNGIFRGTFLSSSSSSSSSSSPLPLSVHRADRVVVDNAFREVTLSLSSALLLHAPLVSATDEVRDYAASHHRNTFKSLFDVISSSWSFDITSSNTPVLPPSSSERFLPLQNVDCRSINAAADCILWAGVCGNNDSLTTTSTNTSSLFRSVDLSSLYFAAAAHSFHHNHNHNNHNHNHRKSQLRFSHPLSTPSNVSSHLGNTQSNSPIDDATHVSRMVRVLLDANASALCEGNSTTSFIPNALDVPAASLSDLCLHLISSRSQLWTFVRVLASISLPGAEAPLLDTSIKHKKGLLSSKMIIPSALLVKSKKQYNDLHELIAAGRFDDTVRSLFASITSTSSTTKLHLSEGSQGIAQGMNPSSGSVKSSWLALLSRRVGNSSAVGFARFRLSQTSVADLVAGRRAVPPSPTVSLRKVINWDSLAYMTDEDLFLNEKRVRLINKEEDEEEEDDKGYDKDINNQGPSRSPEGVGGGGGFLAAQMAALQSRSLSEPQHHVSIFGDLIISHEKSPLLHLPSTSTNDAVLAQLRSLVSSSTSTNLFYITIHELIRHGSFIFPQLADKIASITNSDTSSIPSTISSDSSLHTLDKSIITENTGNKSSTSSSQNLYLLPLLTHLRAQAAAVICELPGASQLQKHIPALGSGLGSSGINHALNACADVGALSIALEILDETAPLYINPRSTAGVGVSGSGGGATVEPLVRRHVWRPSETCVSAIKRLAIQEGESGVAIALDILLKREQQLNAIREESVSTLSSSPLSPPSSQISP